MKADTSRSSFDAAKHFRSVRRQQGRVDLDADWNEQQDILDHLRTGTAADVIGSAGGPVGGAAFAVTPDGTDLRLSTGHYYVDGMLVECEGPDEGVSVWDQPDVPPGSAIIRLEDGTAVAGPTPPAGRYLVYVDVFDLHRTALEDPGIREVALGGPDSTTRIKTVWQVGLLRLGDVDAAVDCATVTPAWTELTTEATGRLAARAEPASGDPGPCVVPAGAGYRGLENQHYRVEIHAGGQTGAATYLWARDNASRVASWVAGPDADGAITVASPGRDSVTGFTPGRWVELTDDTRELLGTPGTLVQLAGVTGNRLTISPAAGVDLTDYPLRPRVRRWDCYGEQAVERPAENDGWLALENGVEVRFADSATYHTDDYWTIPARTDITDILWPRAATSSPLAVAPHGVRHHFAKLALVSFDGDGWADPSDCRALFPPLTGLGAPAPEPGLHVVRSILDGSGGELANDADVPAAVLAQGVTITVDGALDPETADRATCFVTIELPFPSNSVDREQWGTTSVLAYQPLVLAATVEAAGDQITWVPTDPTRQWLLGLPARMRELGLDDRLLCRLTLRGNFIMADGRERYLDGDAFLDPDGGTGVRLPSGDDRRGGPFELWFWLTDRRP